MDWLHIHWQMCILFFYYHYMVPSFVITFVLMSILSDINVTAHFVIYVCVQYFFSYPLTFRLCVFRSDMSLLEATYTWVLFCMHLATLCLLIGAYSPPTFKVIIIFKNIYLFTWLYWVFIPDVGSSILVVAHRIFNYTIQTLSHCM